MEDREIVLLNVSKKTSTKLKIKIAADYFSKARGLMFRKKIVPILFLFKKEDIYPIHSFFVNFEFDAIYLSKNKKVTEMFLKIRPNSLIFPCKKAYYLLELPASVVDKLKISQKDKLDWKIER